MKKIYNLQFLKVLKFNVRTVLGVWNNHKSVIEHLDLLLDLMGAACYFEVGAIDDIFDEILKKWWKLM